MTSPHSDLTRESPGHQDGSLGGFTLTELMVAVSLTGLLVAGALNIFIQQRTALKSNHIISEMRQNVRTAIDMVSRDTRMAGYGLEVNDADLSDWVDWAVDISGSPVTMDSNPKVVQDANGTTDGLWIAAAFEDPVAELSAESLSGTNTLTLGSGEGDAFNTTDKKLIFIGKVETARITGIAGDVLTISTHATTARGLQYDHPANTVIELVKVRSYEWATEVIDYPYQPYLTRDDSIAGTFTYYWQRMIANGISDFQITESGDRIDIAIDGKASVKDNSHLNGDGGTKYRKLSMNSSVMLRNK